MLRSQWAEKRVERESYEVHIVRDLLRHHNGGAFRGSSRCLAVALRAPDLSCSKV
jgi:hypothetical protein